MGGGDKKLPHKGFCPFVRQFCVYPCFPKMVVPNLSVRLKSHQHLMPAPLRT